MKQVKQLDISSIFYTFKLIQKFHYFWHNKIRDFKISFFSRFQGDMPFNNQEVKIIKALTFSNEISYIVNAFFESFKKVFIK